MSANILVQHYAGQIDGDDTVHRICIQCIEACFLNPVWSIISPSFTQHTRLVPLEFLDFDSFLSCGCCLDPCFIVLQRFSDPDPSSCEPLVSVDQVPPPSVQYSLPFLGQPEPFEAIIEALSLEMHRMQMAEAAVPAPEPEPEPMIEE
ncbi:putative membrane protein [Frankliniella fusca]|uniref:Membrane protein n=1 Tax=Frankliniella fusca TaxID=407009 RepID=A0AAE1GVI3_9NEOP|nr:putative membrane protein [Frankliniella fusca]